MSGRGKRAAGTRREEESLCEDNNTEQPPKKYPKPDSSSTVDTDDIVVCELGRNRKVSVRNFRGKINLDIREFYSKDGKLLPGKKGITLPLDQWNILRDHMEEIDKALGHS